MVAVAHLNAASHDAKKDQQIETAKSGAYFPGGFWVTELVQLESHRKFLVNERANRIRQGQRLMEKA